MQGTGLAKSLSNDEFPSCREMAHPIAVDEQLRSCSAVRFLSSTKRIPGDPHEKKSFGRATRCLHRKCTGGECAGGCTRRERIVGSANAIDCQRNESLRDNVHSAA